MSALAGCRVPTHGTEPTANAQEGRRRVGGYVWFALMVGGWAVLLTLIAFSDSTLAGLYADLRALPLLVELFVWFLTFPFALALTVWESAWEPATRIALVVCISIAWSALFFPRPDGR
jgi:hypothetical protein